MKSLILVALMGALISCEGMEESHDGVDLTMCTQVGGVPDSIREDLSLPLFYLKYVDADGLPILSSGAPEDESVRRACNLVVNMLSDRPDVREKLIELHARFVVIGRNEGVADIPEYEFENKPQSEKDAINARARGLGGQVASCGEENLMCRSDKRYPTESICVHEFSHTISQAVYELDRGFEDRLQSAFDNAVSHGILLGTYRGESPGEYWAEGVQDWYGTNAEVSPPDGVHNAINTRKELEEYDPRLFKLVSEVFPEDVAWGDCHVP